MKNVMSIFIGAFLLCVASLNADPAPTNAPTTDPTSALGRGDLITNPRPCQVSCSKLLMPQCIFNTNSDGTVQAIADWTISEIDSVKIVLVAAPVWMNEDLTPWNIVGPEKAIGSLTAGTRINGYDLITGTPDTFADKVDENYNTYMWYGWYFRFYMIRLCDNTVLGWSDIELRFKE